MSFPHTIMALFPPLQQTLNLALLHFLMRSSGKLSGVAADDACSLRKDSRRVNLLSCRGNPIESRKLDRVAIAIGGIFESLTFVNDRAVSNCKFK